jgi:tRNA pseudouridine13 synthase
VVAERCILESYKKQHGETRNALGALSTVTEFSVYCGSLRTQFNHCDTDRSRGT